MWIDRYNSYFSIPCGANVAGFTSVHKRSMALEAVILSPFVTLKCITPVSDLTECKIVKVKKIFQIALFLKT